MPRLEQRILEKGSAGFLRGLDSEGGLRDDLDVAGAEQCRELPHLAGIATGENGLHGPQPRAARACDCSAKIFVSPWVARSSRASSSCRRKAWPSAVPWTSTKAPPLFLPTFISVSACESSA